MVTPTQPEDKHEFNRTPTEAIISYREGKANELDFHTTAGVLIRNRRHPNGQEDIQITRNGQTIEHPHPNLAEFRRIIDKLIRQRQASEAEGQAN